MSTCEPSICTVQKMVLTPYIWKVGWKPPSVGIRTQVLCDRTKCS